MIYSDFQNEKISLLGFGVMRLPLLPDGKTIDEATVSVMTDYAIKNGVNYFDTAFPYHGGMSEIVMGKVLSKYKRSDFYLASKYPGHQIADKYDPADIFEKQLKKCGVDYFDFYLLHNVYELSYEVYTDPKWGILPYFLEQKKLGRIKHLGFSCHSRPDNMRQFLDYAGDSMEFCQIQLNYLDWTLQDAKAKYDMLVGRGIPTWVMEPLRGGKLANANVPEPVESAFRFLMTLPNVKVILSGMSSFEQMKDNVRIFQKRAPLKDTEVEKLLLAAEGMKNSLPCTGCRYCVEGCPMGLNIPDLIATCNDVRFGKEGGMTASMQMEALPPDKHPSACIGCGACARVCPQKIDIPRALKELCDALPSLPQWSKICKIRAEEAKALEARSKGETK